VTTATNEVQVVTVTAATDGDFTLTLDDQETAAIAYDAAASAVDTALEALSNIPAGGVAVTGDAGGPWTVTFTGGLAAQGVSLLVADGTGLVGTGAAVAVVTTVPGSAADAANAGVPMHVGDPDEPQGPEDALGVGTKRGDYSGRGDGKTHYEGTTLQEYGPWGDHAAEPTKKGGVSTTE
jgi:hypothetical protein